MKLNREAAKKGFIGFKLDQGDAVEFRRLAKSKGGASAILQQFVRRYIRRFRADRRAA